MGTGGPSGPARLGVCLWGGWAGPAAGGGVQQGRPGGHRGAGALGQPSRQGGRGAQLRLAWGAWEAAAGALEPRCWAGRTVYTLLSTVGPGLQGPHWVRRSLVPVQNGGT